MTFVRSAGGRNSFRAGLAGLGSAQKPGAGVPGYTRWVNRRLARFAAAAAHAIGLSANAVTTISALVSSVALVVLITGPVSPSTGLAVAGLLAIGYVLDSADGQVARLSGTSSLAGEWLDHVVDAIRTPAIHLSVFVVLARDGHGAIIPLQFVALTYALLTVGQFMSQILAEQLGRRNSTSTQVLGLGIRQSIILLPTDMGAVCWMFALWGYPQVFAVAYTAMFALNAIHTVISMYRKYRSLKLAV